MLEESQMSSRRGKLVSLFINNKPFRVFFFEFIATAFLMFMVTSVGTLPPFEDHPHDTNPYRLVYVVLIVYTIICFIGPFTGAHINPAVTLGLNMHSQKKGTTKVVLTYWGAQVLGGLLGVVLSRNIGENGGAAFTEMPDSFQLCRLCLEEMVGTFLFLFFIQLVTTEETSFVYDQAWVHLMIGIFYYFCLTVAHSRHYINPAVVTSLQLQAMIEDGTPAAPLLAAVSLVLFQIVGAILSSIVFRKVYLQAYVGWKAKMMLEE